LPRMSVACAWSTIRGRSGVQKELKGLPHWSSNRITELRFLHVVIVGACIVTKWVRWWDEIIFTSYRMDRDQFHHIHTKKISRTKQAIPILADLDAALRPITWRNVAPIVVWCITSHTWGELAKYF
jgi:hypothetical protein